MHTAALILAGGKSSRFGRDKSLLTLHGERIMDQLVAQCRMVCDETVILCGEREKFHIEGVLELPDLVPDQGPLGGISTGMSKSGAELFLVLACDMPRFDAELAKRMLRECAGGYDACVPKNGERLEPLCAVYRRTALPQIQGMLDRGEYKIRMLFPRIRTRYLEDIGPADADIFYNINYPADYTSLTKE